MSNASALGKLIPVALASVVVLFSFAVTPIHAAAQTTGTIQTDQLLPPGQNTCQAMTVTDIQPHVYGGVLQSFDVTISDTGNSYVGILAQVGNTAIPLDFITRWAGVPNGLRIHVDTPDMPVNGVLPVNLTLLSSPVGAPTCATTVSFNVTGIYAGGSQTSTTETGTTSNPGYTTPSSGSGSSSNGSPHKATTGGTTTKHTTGGTAMGSSSTSTVLGASTAASSAAEFFSSICSGSNPYRLWFVLLVIYIIIVSIVVFAEPWFLETSVVGSTAAILVPLILLLGFWYFSSACRAASWIPVVACVIAIVGLFLAFREYELPPLLPAPSEQ